MTHLRKMMLEDLQRRNYAETTINCYIRAVEDFSRYFNCSPDRLGPRHIREYQAALFQKRKFSPTASTLAQSEGELWLTCSWPSLTMIRSHIEEQIRIGRPRLFVPPRTLLPLRH